MLTAFCHVLVTVDFVLALFVRVCVPHAGHTEGRLLCLMTNSHGTAQVLCMLSCIRLANSWDVVKLHPSDL